MGKARHSARTSWIYVDGESFAGARADIGDDPENSDLHIAILVPSARPTTSPWTHSKNTT
jgi:hypothetical protein